MLDKVDIGIICAMNVEIDELGYVMEEKKTLKLSGIEFLC